MLNQAMAPVQGAVGSVLGKGVQSILGGVLPFANGAAFGAGRGAAFAGVAWWMGRRFSRCGAGWG